MARMLGKNQYWSEVKDDNISAGCEICTILTGLEIDACKTGIHPKFNSIFKKNDVEYLKEFKQFLDELQYITWKNFKMNESGDICKYVVNGESKVEVKKDSEYILQNLAFEFMKIGISRNEEKETIVSDDIRNNVLFTLCGFCGSFTDYLTFGKERYTYRTLLRCGEYSPSKADH